MDKLELKCKINYLQLHDTEILPLLSPPKFLDDKIIFKGSAHR